PNWSRQGIRDHLGTCAVGLLQQKYDQAVQNGHITPPKDELAEARDIARRVKQDHLRRENRQLVDQVNQSQLGILTDKLFQPHAIFPNKVLVDSQATRQELIDLINPGEQIDNPVKWLRQVLKDNPALVQTLPFTDFETKMELQQQAQEQIEQDKEELRKEHLRELSRTNNIGELRRIAAQEHTQNAKTSYQLQFEYGLLKSWGERESTFPKLPDTWLGQPLDPSFIRKASPDTLRSIMRKHGRCQLDARLHQLAPDFFENWATKLYEIEKQIQTQSGIRSY